MNNSIYITDLDHTFLRTDHSLSQFSKDIWNKKSKKYILSVATARSYQKTLDFLKNLHLNAPMILLDGTMIISPDKKIIDLKTMNKNLGDAIVEEGLKFDISPFIIGFEDEQLNETFLYPKRLNNYQKFVLDGYKNDPRMKFNPSNKSMKMNLKIVYFAKENLLRPLSIHLKNIFKDSIEIKLSPEKYSDGYFLTILHPKGDKAHALKKLLEYLGKEAKELTVFGDSINDISMFNLANKAIAVSNALDEVKAVADIVLEYSNDEDAVAKYLEQC